MTNALSRKSPIKSDVEILNPTFPNLKHNINKINGTVQSIASLKRNAEMETLEDSYISNTDPNYKEEKKDKERYFFGYKSLQRNEHRTVYKRTNDIRNLKLNLTKKSLNSKEPINGHHFSEIYYQFKRQM